MRKCTVCARFVRAFAFSARSFIFCPQSRFFPTTNVILTKTTTTTAKSAIGSYAGTAGRTGRGDRIQVSAVAGWQVVMKRPSVKRPDFMPLRPKWTVQSNLSICACVCLCRCVCHPIVRQGFYLHTAPANPLFSRKHTVFFPPQMLTMHGGCRMTRDSDVRIFYFYPRIAEPRECTRMMECGHGKKGWQIVFYRNFHPYFPSNTFYAAAYRGGQRSVGAFFVGAHFFLKMNGN